MQAYTHTHTHVMAEAHNKEEQEGRSEGVETSVHNPISSDCVPMVNPRVFVSL